ncbi:hypothetical protein BKA63DRAFT_561147 [Paraphoma chrysanthemicola]|nr:hypothetical protein BKA63DRAFT_561147 [Paraphoma chrysanthemicola]
MAAPNVWTQMNYIPPRGQCNYKQSVLSPKCPCLRFMLHPLKSASSYECDGCNHHASFHSMENKSEDEIRKKWEQEARDKKEEEQEGKARPKKRVRAIEYQDSSRDGELAVYLDDFVPMSKTAGRRGASARKAPLSRQVKGKKKVSQPVEEEDDVVELD